MKTAIASTVRPSTASLWRSAALLAALAWLTVQPASGQDITDGYPRIQPGGITVWYGDWEAIRGNFNISNEGGAKTTLKSVGITLQYVGQSGTTATCHAASIFPNVAQGAWIHENSPLFAVSFSAICTDGAPPLDTHEIVAIVTFKVTGSTQVFATSGRVHL